MSENQLQNFEDFIKGLTSELDTVDKKYLDDKESDDCAKCLEKLNIYTRYTKDLINNNLWFYSSDISENESIQSRSFCTDGNTRIHDNINVVRNCLDNRIQMEEQAIDSLLQVENIVESMLKDYCRLIEENKHLNEELQNCTEVFRGNFDVIATHESENEQLNGEKYLDESDEDSTITNVTQNDCQAEIEQLQQQLAEKDETIEQLMAELNDLKPISKEPRANEFDSYSEHAADFSEASLNFKNKVRDLERISADVEAIFNENQNQLLEQQAKIDELTKLLESQSKPSNTRNNENSESICLNKLKEMENRDQILAQQLAIYEEQIAVLMDDRKNLVEINNDLIKSVSICQTQIAASI